MRNFYIGRFEKRRGGRMQVAGTASADFLTPSGLRITNISRAGVGLSGVVRIGARDSGIVNMYLPGSYELTTALAQVSWSDRQGHVGLKFIQLQTIADEWKPWFTGPSETEPPASEEEPTDKEVLSTLRKNGASTEVAGATAEAHEDTAAGDYDLRKELARAPRRHAWVQFTKRLARIVAVMVLMAAGAGAAWYLWQEHATYWLLARSKMSTMLASAPSPSSEPASPAAKPGTESKAARSITLVQVVEGEPELELRRGPKKPAFIERGKPIGRPDPAYLGAAMHGTKSEVALLLTIDEKGTVNEVQIVRGDPRLAREAASAAGHWRYTPFISNSSPVNVTLPVTIKFEKKPMPPNGAPR